LQRNVPAPAAPVVVPGKAVSYQPTSNYASPVAAVVAAVAVVDSMPNAHQGFDLDRPLREARDGFEKAYFEFHLAREGGSMTRVAEKTGLERTHLYRKLRQLGVDLTRNKKH
jgi:DNA-binding NtrC family response regulator